MIIIVCNIFENNLKYVPILNEVTSEKCNSVELNTFTTYLSSLLGVIAEYNSSDFFQNWYFNTMYVMYASNSLLIGTWIDNVFYK